MNVEDSYEGAVRRLQRLERAGIAMDASPTDVAVGAARDGSAERMRELEELASLACEDNERLKSELGVTLQALDERRQELVAARAELGRLQQELQTARREVDVLRGCVAELQAAPASVAQVSAPLPPQPFAAPSPPHASAFAPHASAFAPHESAFAPPPSSPAPFAAASPFSEALPEDDYALASRSRSKAAWYFFVLALAGAIIAALCVTRPWASVASPPPPVEWHVPPPVVTAPPPAPPVQPAVPKVEAAAPRSEPMAPREPERKRARHPADKDPASATSHEATPDPSDDPLAGTNL
jgi:hypothetical protein